MSVTDEQMQAWLDVIMDGFRVVYNRLDDVGDKHQFLQLVAKALGVKPSQVLLWLRESQMRSDADERA